MNKIDTINMSMRIAHGITQLVEDTTLLGGDAGLEAVKVLTKLEKKFDDKHHSLLVQSLIDCIKIETKGCYVSMSSMIPKATQQEKVVPNRIPGDPPEPVVKETYHQQGQSTGSLWLNFNSTQKGISGAKYPEMSSYRCYTKGKESVEVNAQGWCDRLPAGYDRQLKKSPGGLYFPLNDFATRKYKGKKQTIDGLEMGLVQVRTGKKAAKKRSGMQVIGFRQ
jgi:hypothetical protein